MDGSAERACIVFVVSFGAMLTRFLSPVIFFGVDGTPRLGSGYFVKRHFGKGPATTVPGIDASQVFLQWAHSIVRST
jgi:hypothetical protein